MDQRKKQVVIGDLPDDFLRFDATGSSSSANVATLAAPPDGGKPAPSQLELDEQAARSLHLELNSQTAAAAGDGVPGAFYAAGGAGFVPANTKGRLSICLVQARLTKNYGFVKMDPYCRVRVGNTVFETPTNAGGGKTPHWNRTVYCYLPQGIDSIYLEIFDERAFSTDERIAWNRIVIPEAVFNGDTIDDWYTLSGQQGDAKEGMINMVFTLYPVNAPHVAYVPVTQPPQPIVVTGGSVPPTAIPYGLAGQVGQPTNLPSAGTVAAPPQPQAMFSEADVKEIQEMFTNMDLEVIKSVMYEKRGHKEATVNALLAMTADDNSGQTTPAATVTSDDSPKNVPLGESPKKVQNGES